MPRHAEIDWSSEDVGFAALGRGVRELRLARGVSVRELAADAKVSKNTILRLERGEPVTRRVLDSVCAALNTVPPQLTAGGTEPASVRVFHADETKWAGAFPRAEAHGNLANFTPVPDPSERVRYGRLGFVCGFTMSHDCALPGGKMQAMLYEVHHSLRSPFQHAGEEFVYCVRGDVRMRIGEETYELSTGDSLTFDSSLPHNFTRVEPPPSPAPQVLWVWVEGSASKG